MDTDMCYVAKDGNRPGFCAAMVDSPDHAKDTAKTVASWIKKGMAVSRVTVVEARAGLGEYLASRKPALGKADDLVEAK